MMKNLLLFVSLIFYQFVLSQSNYKLSSKILKNKTDLIEIETTLTNNTKDTLQFYSMSCSWEENYTVDSKKIIIETSMCDKNFPKLISLAPNKSRTEIIHLINQQKSKKIIKIGFVLIEKDQYDLFINFSAQKKKKIIWSNDVKI